MAWTKLYLNLTRLYHKTYDDSPILFVMTSVGSIITVITISWMLILWSLVGMLTPTLSDTLPPTQVQKVRYDSYYVNIFLFSSMFEFESIFSGWFRWITFSILSKLNPNFFQFRFQLVFHLTERQMGVVAQV